jgi:hypothetical protein
MKNALMEKGMARTDWRGGGEGTFLDLGGLGEAHVIYALEQIGVAVAQR